MGYIYLINELGTNNYKIGVTKHDDINNRKSKLQTGNSNELYLIRKYETNYPFKLEQMLHRHYFKNNIKNEWFLLTDEQVFDFINVCDKYNNIINLLKSENPFY